MLSSFRHTILTNSKIRRTVIRFSLFHAATFSFINESKSQAIIPAVGVEQTVANLASTRAAVVNTDFYEFANTPPAGPGLMVGTIKAIVYDEYSSSGTRVGATLWVQDNIGNVATYALPSGASSPDVSISEDCSTPGRINWRILVVYSALSTTPMTPPRWGFHSEPELLILDLLNVSTTGLALTPATTGFANPYPLTTAGTACSSPHIDMWTDRLSLNPHTGLPSRHKYAVVWSNDIAGPASISIAYGDVAPMTVPVTVSSLATDASNPDIAVLTEFNGVNYSDKVEIVYSHDNPHTWAWRFQLMHLEYDMLTSVATLRLLEDSVSAPYPRIEAMSQYSNTGGTPPRKWFVVAPLSYIRHTGFPPGHPASEVGGYHNYSFPPTVPPVVFPMPTSLLQIDQPLFNGVTGSNCVAAGVGTVYGSSADFGNTQYTVGHCPLDPAVDTTTFFVRAITTDALLPSDPDQYAINNSSSPVIGAVGGWGTETFALALANCSNSGKDLLAAWYNGREIVYKHSAGTMSFREEPTRISELENSFAAFPNPMYNSLSIRGARNCTYVITDITGRHLLTGEITDTQHQIDVQGLQRGIYMLSVQYPRGTQTTIKLIKN